jgi:hypothetical protein
MTTSRANSRTTPNSRPAKGLTATDIARALGLTYLVFAETVDDMIQQEGFPYPMIDLICAGRPRHRRWCPDAFAEWKAAQSYRSAPSHAKSPRQIKADQRHLLNKRLNRLRRNAQTSV